MTMPSTGPLNMGGTSSPVSVAQELGLSLTATISMHQTNVRTLAAVGGSGTSWSMSSLYGKSNTKVGVAPEVRGVMVGGGSAMMCRLTNSLSASELSAGKTRYAALRATVESKRIDTLLVGY